MNERNDLYRVRDCVSVPGIDHSDTQRGRMIMEDFSRSVTGFGELGPKRTSQVGAHNQCGKAGCTVKETSWRVILGSYQVQAYACTAHLGWACTLDLLTETSASRMGWARTEGTIHPVQVTPELSAIKRTDFRRYPDVSAMYPQARPRSADDLTELRAEDDPEEWAQYLADHPYVDTWHRAEVAS